MHNEHKLAIAGDEYDPTDVYANGCDWELETDSFAFTVSLRFSTDGLIGSVDVRYGRFQRLETPLRLVSHDSAAQTFQFEPAMDIGLPLLTLIWNHDSSPPQAGEIIASVDSPLFSLRPGDDVEILINRGTAPPETTIEGTVEKITDNRDDRLAVEMPNPLRSLLEITVGVGRRETVEIELREDDGERSWSLLGSYTGGDIVTIRVERGEEVIELDSPHPAPSFEDFSDDSVEEIHERLQTALEAESEVTGDASSLLPVMEEDGDNPRITVLYDAKRGDGRHSRTGRITDVTPRYDAKTDTTTYQIEFKAEEGMCYLILNPARDEATFSSPSLYQRGSQQNTQLGSIEDAEIIP